MTDRAALRRARIAVKPITEAEFQVQVIALARLCGFRVAHFRPGRTARGKWRTPVAADGQGFFDLVLIRKGRVIFAELKCGKNVLAPEQQAWANEARGGGSEVYCWYPSDWDEIIKTLQ